MAVASGDMDTLGASLGTDSLWGASRVNPTDMKNNCVSVSTARLENYLTVSDFWQEKLQGPLPDLPLNYYQIVSLLRLTGRRYFWKQYACVGGKSAYQNLHADPPTYSASTNSGKHTMPILGLLMYTRPTPLGCQGSRHCINMRFVPGYQQLNGTHVPASLKLRDFQADDRGIADEEDIKQAVNIWAVYDGIPRQPSLFVDAQNRTALEKRGLVLQENGIIPLSLWVGLEIRDNPPPRPAAAWNYSYGMESSFRCMNPLMD